MFWIGNMPILFILKGSIAGEHEFRYHSSEMNDFKDEMREFNVVAESENHLFVVETKATPRTTDIQKFIDFVPEITDWFPAARTKTIVPVLASLYLPPDVVHFLTRNRIFALAMKDDNMDLLNPELLHQ
jgi:hypothetical protein